MAMDAEEARKAIFRAVDEGNVDEVTRLLDARPDLVRAEDHPRGVYKPLLAASKYGHVDVVRLLLARGSDVNDREYYGLTALHAAAQQGNEDIIDVLLRSGADSCWPDEEGVTSLIMASEEGHLGVVRQLLEHMGGRGLDHRTTHGATALYYACDRGRAEVVRELLLAGADYTIADLAGQTPRQRAARKRRFRTAGVIRRWEYELERPYTLYRARHVSECGALVPAYLRQRVERGEQLPSVQLQGASGEQAVGGEGGQPSEEEKDATLKFVIEDLAPELFIELMAGFYK